MKKTLMMGLMDEIHHRSLCLCPPPSPAAATKEASEIGNLREQGAALCRGARESGRNLEGETKNAVVHTLRGYGREGDEVKSRTSFSEYAEVAFFVFITRVEVRSAFSCERSEGSRSVFSVIEKKQVLFCRFSLLLFMSVPDQDLRGLVMYCLNLCFCCHDFLSKQIYKTWNTIRLVMYVRISGISSSGELTVAGSREVPGYEKQHWCRKCLSCGFFSLPECDGCGSMAFVALVHLPVAIAAVQKDSVIGLATNFNKPNGHNRWDF